MNDAKKSEGGPLSFADVKQFGRKSVDNGPNLCWVNSVLYAFASNKSLIEQYHNYKDICPGDSIQRLQEDDKTHYENVYRFLMKANETPIWKEELYQEYLDLATEYVGHDTRGTFLPEIDGTTWNPKPVFTHIFSSLFGRCPPSRIPFYETSFILSSETPLSSLLPQSDKLICMVRNAHAEIRSKFDAMTKGYNNHQDIEFGHWVSFSRIEGDMYRKFDALLEKTTDVNIIADCKVQKGYGFWCICLFQKN